MEYIYVESSQAPQASMHWQSLRHQEGDVCIENVQALQAQLVADLAAAEDNKNAAQLDVAVWSALLGYCEALCTSTTATERYNPYPIPLDALRRLVQEEFTPPPTDDSSQRQAARDVSNWVWSKVMAKSNVKDEKHANSLYTVLRGHIDKKSVDCFGAALVTVVGLRRRQISSTKQPATNVSLQLSEDHAYARLGSETYEVAIPGNTKAQKQKRGQEVAQTFADKKPKQSSSSSPQQLTPATSWLYMADHAVSCDTAPLILAAALANVNCLIDTKAGTYERYSQPLLLIKRELLWTLYDAGHLSKFPFALCELGWAEEHATSPRGEANVSMEWESNTIQVTKMEHLYHEAIQSSKEHYADKQVYPYCYMAFYHKDGGQQEEYRLALAMQFFAQAARVASTYQYEWGDTLQLTKVFVKVSEFVVSEILTDPVASQPRTWRESKNAVECGKWLMAFFDYLLLWEEFSGSDSFLPICQGSHKTGIARAFALLSVDIRKQALEAFVDVKSRRFQGPLRTALAADKVAISEMHLTIVSDSTRQRRKRKTTS